MNTCQEPTIALLPWGHVWEDFYDSIGVSLEAFCNEMTGGWQFGYIDALKLAGVRTLVIYPSTRVTEPTRFTHKPTGCTICLLPVPKSYLAIRRRMKLQYPSFGGSIEALFGEAKGTRRTVHKILGDIAPYLATPIGLVAQELRKEGCHAILCQEYEYFRFDVCALLGRMTGLPVFATFQGTNGDGNWFGRKLHPLTIKSCGGLIIGPQTEIQRVRTSYSLPPQKTAQIFNPLDLDLWHPVDRAEARAKLNLPAHAHVVIWHGRVEMHIKGLDVLLDAWKQICLELAGRDLRLLLIGTGRDAEKLKQRIAELPLKNVQWVNEYINDRAAMRQLLSAADVYAFPSRFEGFPVAPTEAMACGLPVVAAAAPGIPDIFKAGEQDGGIVVPCDDAIAFASALKQVLEDTVYRDKLAYCARRRIEEHFSLEAIGKQLRSFLLQEMKTVADL